MSTEGLSEFEVMRCCVQSAFTTLILLNLYVTALMTEMRRL